LGTGVTVCLAKELTVAPALQPVRTDNPWVIFDSPERPRKVLPQKSLEALREQKIQINWIILREDCIQFDSTFWSFKEQRRKKT
jgi:hypothetical protein